ncbi:MAG: flagellar basal body protein [Planctomycetota bacterium]|jgi:flagellar basal body rod protein FlgG
MNYGLYLAASGALTNIHRQEVITNNLANATTAGFKPDMVYARQRLPERLESGAGTDPKELLEQLGGGTALMPTRLDLSQGAVTARAPGPTPQTSASPATGGCRSTPTVSWS